MKHNNINNHAVAWNDGWGNSEWRDVSKMIRAGAAYFWSNDECRGWDKDGKRIGTGIPRKQPISKAQGANDHNYAKNFKG